MADLQEMPAFLASRFPVVLPHWEALSMPEHEFKKFLKLKLGARDQDSRVRTLAERGNVQTSLRAVTPATGMSEHINMPSIDEIVESSQPASNDHSEDKDHEAPFLKALFSERLGKTLTEASLNMNNKMLTENHGIAYRSTNEPLVDLFTELEEVVTGPRLSELLEAAWRDDPLSTLKIIFNSRSIHLGKASRYPTYRCLGWLAQHHPLTLVTNLRWLTRPVIEKPKNKEEGSRKDVKEADDDDDDFMIVEESKSEDDPTFHDAKNGMAHGYWKDILNLLVLRVKRKLHVLGNPRQVFNVRYRNRGPNRPSINDLHQKALRALEDDPVYLALHLTVARLFAEQLKADMVLLKSKKPGAQRYISLCAKWAPSQKLLHDKHTFIVSSISEIMYPHDQFDSSLDRETYLRHAREAYRKDVSALRKALQVVERDITSESFDQIKYDRVPSLAMQRYSEVFAEKDTDRFDEYLTNVAMGKSRISGATLTPAAIIAKIRATEHEETWQKKKDASSDLRQRQANARKRMERQLLHGQWQALVQRIKNSGVLENAMAVCDVSQSMTGPEFPDKTIPMDSAIGLSLVLASVCEKPWRDAIITFSRTPQAHQIPDGDIWTKYKSVASAFWSTSTNLVAIFEDLILPMAKEHNLTQEQMVKRIFVFSDMQFDMAQANRFEWSTSYERIKAEYKRAGYEMPELVFWNLAGGRTTRYGYSIGGPGTVPKPVTAREKGTAIISGYSQNLLKVFLDSGSFEDVDKKEEEQAIEMMETEDGLIEVSESQRQEMDPLSTVKKAINHKAYSMLEVMD